MKNGFKVLEDLSWFLQLGLSLVTPLLLTMGLCWWLVSRFGWSGWIFLPGVLLGLGAGVVSFRSFSRSILRRPENRTREKPPVRFNRHQ